jgi:gliding motility-associated-like protein
MKQLYYTLLALTLIFFANQSFGQLVASPTATAQQGIELLMGPGAEAFNIASSGNANQVGTFTCVNCGIGFPSGMIVATGNVTVAQGPNNIGSATVGGGNFGVSDPDLAMLTNLALNDAATVTFNFVAQSDSVSFNYVFASEEYPEFANSSFNDVFGFFLSGPGITGPYSNNAINIALIPGTNQAVSINNVNAGNNDLGCVNCQYYVINTSNNSPLSTQFDGYTVQLEAAYDQLICGETYQIKIAIADAGDTSYDSAVFFEANSFTLPSVDVSLELDAVNGGENTLLEGCGLATVIFERNGDLSAEQILDLSISGTALNGIDYTSLPETIVFEPGQSITAITIQALLDGITEPMESLIISYSAAGTCTSITEQTLEIFIVDVQPLVIEIDDVNINCNESTTLVPTVSGGYGVYTYNWVGFGSTATIDVSPAATTTYLLTVSDTCGLPSSNASATVYIPVLDPIVPITGGPIGIDCLTSLSSTAQATGGNGEYQFSWLDPFGNELSNTADVSYDPAAEGSLLLVVTDGCGISQIGELEFFFNEVPINLELPANLVAECTIPLTVEPSVVNGGIGNLTYAWQLNGQPYGTNAASATVALTQSTVLTLVVSDQCANSASAAVNLTIAPQTITVNLGENITRTCLDASLIAPSIVGGTPAYSYVWQVNGNQAAFTPTYTVQVAATSSVSLEVTDVCGNQGSDVLQVFIPPVPMSLELGEDFVVPCQDEVEIVSSASGGVGNYTYNWLLNGFDQPNSNAIEFIAVGVMQVTLEVEDQCGNSVSDALTVTIPTLPPQVVVTADTLICKGDVIQLTAEVLNPIGQYMYTWLPTYQSGDFVNVSPIESTVYSVAVTDQCQNTTINEIFVAVDIVIANFDFSYYGNWGIETFNTSDPANAEFLWDFGDGSTSTEFEPTYTFITNDTQTVTLYATDDLGCVDSITGVFHPLMDVFVPSAFTPNGDGINDVFRAQGHSVKQFEMWIYNRWGKEVFYSNDINAPWLGDVNGGDHFGQDEVYQWVIKAVGIRNTSFERSGFVVLTR